MDAAGLLLLAKVAANRVQVEVELTRVVLGALRTSSTIVSRIGFSSRQQFLWSTNHRRLATGSPANFHARPQCGVGNVCAIPSQD